MVHLYGESVIIPNVPTDIPDGQPGGGKISDHPIVYCVPRLKKGEQPARRLVIKKTRRIDSHRISQLAGWIQHKSWEELYNSKSSSDMAEKLIELVNGKMDQICPEVEVRISQLDGKQTSLALQTLIRQKKREYDKHGTSKRFKE